MSTYEVTVAWQRGEQRFTDNRYSRAHRWVFDGGVVVPASSSPHVVRLPFSDASAVDPEEAFVASISSCHMLMFLSLAAKRGFCIDHYTDAAAGILSENAAGQLAMTRVTLRPEVVFSGESLPTPAEIDALHHAAHEECFIANSVRTEIECHPVLQKE